MPLTLDEDPRRAASLHRGGEANESIVIREGGE